MSAITKPAQACQSYLLFVRMRFLGLSHFGVERKLSTILPSGGLGKRKCLQL
jgi:hypothetical protein